MVMCAALHVLHRFRIVLKWRIQHKPSGLVLSGSVVLLLHRATGRGRQAAGFSVTTDEQGDWYECSLTQQQIVQSNSA